METILSLNKVSKVYGDKGTTVRVLDEVTAEFFQGESISLVGPSGSGKSTLLGLCAGLDRPTSGEIRLLESELSSASEEERARLRAAHIGFVFQSFQLIPTLSALENVMLPAELIGKRGSRREAESMLERVGLSHRIKHLPGELSGGEQQRVALARAYMNRPQILFADEPTGSLDFEHAMLVENLLFELNQEHKTTLIIATHNPELAKKTSRRVKLHRGNLEEVSG